MKKLTFLAALLCASVMAFAQTPVRSAYVTTELVDFSKITLTSSGGSGDPVMTKDAENQTISIQLVGTPGWQWGNQAWITLTNVAESGLDTSLEYKLSFTATASSTDCGGVTLKFFDNNQLFYTGDNYLSFNAPYNFESEWITPTASATNGSIVLDFGWDPVQTITISNLSFLEREVVTAIDNVETDVNAQKVIENGQLVIIKNGIRYNVAGQEVR